MPLSLLYFSLGQFADWFAPFQISFTAALLGLMLCLWAVIGEKLTWPRLGLAMLGALIATLSAFHGLLIWLAFIPSLILQRDRRKLLLWIGATIEIWLLYLAGFALLGHSRTTLHAIYTYVTVYLGSPVGYADVARAQFFGLLGIVLLPVEVAFYLVLGGTVRRILPWVNAALFVVLCTGATMTGRIDGGALSALASRYQIFSAVWWMALIIIGGLVMEELWQRGQRSVDSRASVAIGRVRYGEYWAIRLSAARNRLVNKRQVLTGAHVLVLLAICASLIGANIVGMQDGLLWLDVQRAHQDAIIHYETAPDSCLSLYFPYIDLLRPRVAYLKEAHLGIFAQPGTSRESTQSQPSSNDAAGCTKPYHFIDDTGGGVGITGDRLAAVRP